MSGLSCRCETTPFADPENLPFANSSRSRGEIPGRDPNIDSYLEVVGYADLDAKGLSSHMGPHDHVIGSGAQHPLIAAFTPRATHGMLICLELQLMVARASWHCGDFGYAWDHFAACSTPGLARYGSGHVDLNTAS